jgi:putative transposase
MSQDDVRERRALRRFAVVSRVRTKVLGGILLADAIRQVLAEANSDEEDGETEKATARTIYRWLRQYDHQGFAGLHDKPVIQTKPSRVLSDDFVAYMRQEKEKNPLVGIPQIIRRARVAGKLSADEQVCRTTAYRVAKRLNLPLPIERYPKKGDKRPFAYEHRMQMTLVDGKFFYVGPTRKERVALTFLDDATRKGLDGIVGTVENTVIFLRLLFATIMGFGFMSGIYLDRGGGFIAHATQRVCAKLGIPLIHGRRRYKEGRGKIERFHRTLHTDLLSGLDGNPAVDDHPEALTLLLKHYLTHDYNIRHHEGIDGIPDERFTSDTLSLRYPESQSVLRREFILPERRKVRLHNVVLIDKVMHEVPLGYAGKTVWVYRHVLEDRVYVEHEGRLIEIRPADVHANARARRAWMEAREPERPMPSETAAMMSYQKAYAPMVGADGGFPKTEDDES